MSLTSLLDRHPEVARRLASLVPDSVRPPRVTASMRAPPVTDHYALVGTAFDYLFRFEVQRRYPNTVVGTWVAQHGVDILARLSRARDAKGRVMLHYRVIGGPDTPLDRKALGKVAEKGRRILTQAKTDVAGYQKVSTPSDTEKAVIAEHALRLAKLDGMFSRGELDVSMEDADEVDVRDLLCLLDFVPFDILDERLREGLVLLNPTFGTFSGMVGGADADIVASGFLLDIKTTKYPDFVNAKWLPQVVGYAILADLHRGEEPTFPEPREVGFYFSRHGEIQTVSHNEIRNHPDFADARDALLQAAKEDYPPMPRIRVSKEARRRPLPTKSI